MTSSVGTILLVEDDFVLRAALAELFTSEGYSVACAANGLEAFALLSNKAMPKPSVIVLDLMMPYMDGIEFRALQRSLPSVSDVPVVVITANGSVAVEAEQLAVARTMFKPVNSWRLLDAVRELAPAAA
ncbi:MAG TPA: response regulator [Polyangia bacterium]|nr:response regulator [Polyangia bacterium]